MGARQSKRSVDITTGKEVVVTNDGEGKVERIEDVDALKPQLNGDTTHEEIQISDKEKNMQQQDEQPENEKDTATEKEIILTPVENGNGEEAEAPVSEEKTEKSPENKKTKKDKVKKILSRLSFNKKDKTKPVKKELTNGECEKVNEEAADNQETSQSESPVAEAPKENSEAVEKTPDTPVTEPLTNGSSAPESPKEVKENGESSKDESPVEVAEKPIVDETPIEADLNGLSLNGLKIDADVAKVDEVVPVPEIPKEAEVEVCVPPPVEEELKANEVEAPPLPTTPPPSNLTMFVESTMATHLVNNTVIDEAPIVEVDTSLSSISVVENVSPLVEDVVSVVTPEPEESVAPVPIIIESNDLSLSKQEECMEIVPDSNNAAVVSSIEMCDAVNDSGIEEIVETLPIPEPLEDMSGSIIPPPLILSNDEICPAPLDSLSPPPPPESCPESISETLPSESSLPPPYSESPEVPDIPAPIESLPSTEAHVNNTNAISPPPLEIPSEYSAKPIEELVQVLPKEVSDDSQPQVKMVSEVIEAVSASEPIAAVESVPSDSTVAVAE